MISHGGGPTAVLNASLYGVAREAMRRSEVGEVLGARFGTEGLIEAQFIDLRAERQAVLDGLPFTPGSALGSSRRRIEPEDYERILANLRARHVRYLLLNGGNGTMLAAAELARLAPDIIVVGIPKTVDNDLWGTDHAPGYPSAARYFAVSALELGRDNEALPFPINLIETMGRNAGWLAAATALGAREPDEGPHLVYFPEVPFDPQQFLREVEEVYRRLGRAVIAVCEGVRKAGGEPVFVPPEDMGRDGWGRLVPGNVTVYLAELVGRELRVRVRNDKPGLCGRASIAHVSPVDRDEAIRCGEEAVRRAIAGESGVMISLTRAPGQFYRCGMGTTPLSEVAAHERPLPREFINEQGNFPSAAFVRYAAPLLGSVMPEFVRLAAARRQVATWKP